MTIQITSSEGRPVTDAALESLVARVYVEEAFTPPELAATLFAAKAVRARGALLLAWTEGEREPVGMVIMVPPTSSARRIARAGEAEMHLLAVDARHRTGGIGRRLIEAAVTEAHRAGCWGIVLWTQPAMHTAQRLYTACGFVRAPARDAQIGALSGRTFLVYERVLDLQLRPARADE